MIGVNSLKIPKKAFAVLIFWASVLSLSAYFGVRLLCLKIFPWLMPFAFALYIPLFATLYYLAVACYKGFSAMLEKNLLIICKGLLIKRRTVLRLERVMSLKLLTTPLMRALGVSCLFLICEGSFWVLPLIKAGDSELIVKTVNETKE